MRNFLKKMISWMLAVITVITCVPTQVLAATANTTEKTNITEINDGYVSVSVSNQNGGFLIDTLLGNQLKSSDDNKNLLYSSEGYDSSFTSIQVTRTDGSVEEYVFGRKYGFLGLASTGVTVEAVGSSITATWGVKDLTVVQTLTLSDETSTEHGLVNIDYDVTTTSDDVANVKFRIMLDTSLGDQDYGFYQLYNSTGEFATVKKECVITNAYDNMLRSVTSDGVSSVNAYTVNAIVDGEEIKPYQVAFGHWANLATTVFDFLPDTERPAFNIPIDAQYLTADSAYALYYELGAVGKNETASVSTYYGIYSNSTVSEDESVAINFIQIPSSMEVKEDSTLESASYYSQVTGGNDGDVEVKLTLENLANSDLEDMYIVVKTMNNVLTYTGNYPMQQTTTDGTHTIHYTDVAAGEEMVLTLYFNVSPLDVGEYRYFEIEVYTSEKMAESSLIGSNGFYLLCPSVLGEQVSFNTTNPQTIYVSGSRRLYVSGENFALLRDTSAYTAYLQPVTADGKGSYSSDLPIAAVVPGKNIVVNDDEDTMDLLVDCELAPGTYQLVLDWHEDGKEDTTSVMLTIIVSDDAAYMNPLYGVVTIEKPLDYTDEDPKYQLVAYYTEEIYQEYWSQLYRSDSRYNRNELVLLEFYGSFDLEYDVNGNLVSAKAISVENADGSVSGTINISNCLDVEGGYVQITVENPGTDDQCINTDIDGHVYVSGERTTVWNGVCALTSIANGDINGLTPYRSDGTTDDTIESKVKTCNTINLLWPTVAGHFQTLMGVFFEFRYCEFGIMATDYTDPSISIHDDQYDHIKKTRVISFSAYLDPSGLLPSSYDWSGRKSTAADIAGLHFSRSSYSPDDLRKVKDNYGEDMKNWLLADTGELSLVVNNILYGGNRFIGFSADLSISLPPYFEGLGGIAGTLHIAYWKSTPDKIGYFEMGVDGMVDIADLFCMEATLVIKTVQGLPLVDEFSIYIGGFSPGLNIDGCGVVWITGLGAGWSGFYDLVMNVETVPVFSAHVEGGLSLFQIVYARLKATIGGRGIKLEAFDIGFNSDTSNNYYGSSTDEILTIFPYLGASIYWYPKFKMTAGIEVGALGIVNGSGYIALEQNTETNKMFFEAMATSTISTPNIPIIGAITLGGVDVGIDLSKLYGVMHILDIDLGLCYYYGESVDFTFGKYDVPGATLLTNKVGELEDGTDVYMAFGTNVVQVANSSDGAVTLGNLVYLTDTANPTITSASDSRSHSFTLGTYTDGDIALTVSFTAATEAQAKAIAMGGWFTEGLSITDQDGNSYELVWLDTSETLTEDTANEANALLNYDADTNEATVTITFTESEDFTKAWKLTSSTACELTMYSVDRLANVDKVEYQASESGELVVNCFGTMLDTIDSLTVSVINSDGVMYHLQTVEDFTVNSDGSVSLRMDIPAYLPTGSYTVQVSAKAEESNVNDIEESTVCWNYINPNQPDAPEIGSIQLGGDYTLDMTVSAGSTKEFGGYLATVYAWDDENNTWVATDYADHAFDPDATGITMGGSCQHTVLLDAEGNEVSYADYANNPSLVVETTTKTVGLTAGTVYRIGICAYNVVDGNYLCSEEVYSSSVTMVAPNPATVTISGQNAKQVQMKDDSDPTQTITKDFYTSNNVTLNLTSDQDATITWNLDNGSQSGTIDLTGGEIHSLLLTADPDTDYCHAGGLSEGGHTLQVQIVNKNGDRSSAFYSFNVDTVAPKIMLTGPDNGSFFGETVTVSGISEADAQVKIELDGVICATVNTDSEGYFTADISMDVTLYEQTLTVYATDNAGNASRSYDLVLTNKLVGNTRAELAIFFNGENVTGQTIPADMDGYVELRYVIGDISLKVPHNSSQGSRIYWDVYAVSGSGSVERDGGFLLTTSADINGMLTVTVDKIQVSAVLGGNVMPQSLYYTVALPTDPIGYTIQTDDSTTVSYGDSFRFTVTVADGYDSSNMVVSANGMALQADANGVYTIENIHADKTVTVTGVVDAIGPEISITIDTNVWRSFLNTISFGLFYADSQKVTIQVADRASGVAGVYYHISDKALTAAEVEALGAEAWTAYTDAFHIDPNGEYVIYAKAIDNAGCTSYVSSDGLVLNNIAPVITGAENNGVYYGDVTLNVADNYLASVTCDGEQVSLHNGSFTVTADNAEHEIIATDKAGNTASIKLTVYKLYTVTFVANNQILATAQAGHGQSIPADQFPTIPEKTGYDQTAPVWTPAELSSVTADMTVVASYTRNSYAVTLPTAPIGYTVNAENQTLFYGEDFTFTVDILPGYSGDGMTVSVNGTVLTPVNGVYTYPGVSADLTVSVTGVADLTPPEATISIQENKWRSFLNTITFGIFFQKNQKVQIQAADNGSGLDKIYYYVSSVQMTEDQLDGVQWESYTAPFHIDQDGRYIVYAKAVDQAGNACYISSDGVVIDKSAPAISGIENGGVYYGDVSAVVTDENIATVVVNGVTVYDALSDEAVISHHFLLTPAEDPQTIVITDKAGNVSTVTVTVLAETADDPTDAPDPAPTGDTASPIAAFTAMIFSAAMLVLLLFFLRRRKMQP